MWFIFLISVIIIAIAGMIVFWIGNSIFLSIQKQNIKFKKRQEKYDENKEQK